MLMIPLEVVEDILVPFLELEDLYKLSRAAPDLRPLLLKKIRESPLDGLRIAAEMRLDEDIRYIFSLVPRTTYRYVVEIARKAKCPELLGMLFEEILSFRGVDGHLHWTQDFQQNQELFEGCSHDLYWTQIESFEKLIRKISRGNF